MKDHKKGIKRQSGEKIVENHIFNKGFMYSECISQSVQSLSHVPLFVTPWAAGRQTFLSITNSPSLLRFMSIDLVKPSDHLVLCCPLLLLPSIFPSIRVFWPKYWNFSFNIVKFYLTLYDL